MCKDQKSRRRRIDWGKSTSFTQAEGNLTKEWRTVAHWLRETGQRSDELLHTSWVKPDKGVTNWCTLAEGNRTKELLHTGWEKPYKGVTNCCTLAERNPTKERRTVAYCLRETGQMNNELLHTGWVKQNKGVTNCAHWLSETEQMNNELFNLLCVFRVNIFF